MSSTTDNTIIHKFDGENYDLWVTKVTALFLLNDCNDIVSGVDVEPEEEGEAKMKYLRRKQKAAALLIRNLSDDVILSTGITGSSSPDEFRKKIRNIYGLRTGRSAQQIKKLR